MRELSREEMQAALAKVKTLKRFAEEFSEDVRTGDDGQFEAENVMNIVRRCEEVGGWIMHHIGRGVHMPYI